jgi:hypothetical protein
MIFLVTNGHGICGHEPISAASRPFDILHIGLMSDAEEWFRLLGAHGSGCQAMPNFGSQMALGLALTSKSGPMTMAFVVMKPYQLPPDPLISSIWV